MNLLDVASGGLQSDWGATCLPLGPSTLHQGADGKDRPMLLKPVPFCEKRSRMSLHLNNTWCGGLVHGLASAYAIEAVRPFRCLQAAFSANGRTIHGAARGLRGTGATGPDPVGPQMPRALSRRWSSGTPSVTCIRARSAG